MFSNIKETGWEMDPSEELVKCNIQSLTTSDIEKDSACEILHILLSIPVPWKGIT